MRKELRIRITFYVLYLCLQEEDEADEEVDDEEGVKDEDYILLCLCLQEEDETDEDDDEEEGVEDEDYILLCLCLQEEDETDEDDDYILLYLCLQEEDEVDEDDDEEEGVEDEDDEGEEDVHVNPYLQINREMDSANIFHILAKNTDKDRQNKARLNTTSSNALG